jgi:hypothetical protein
VDRMLTELLTRGVITPAVKSHILTRLGIS